MIVRSPSPPIEVPDVTVGAFVLRQAERLADKPAIIDAPTGRTLSYGQFADMVRRVATALDRRGFRKGDVFAVYSHNVPEYAVVFNAVALVGGIVTTANPLCTAAELTKQLKDSRPRLMVTALPCLDKAKEAAAAAGVETLYMFGGEGAQREDGVRPFDELLDAPPNPPSVSITPSEDVVVLPYSSGTTGLPKGVMLTHRNMVANLCQINGAEAFDGFQERDRILAVLPLFHIYGMVVVLKLGLANGATIVTMPRFDFEEFLATIQKYRITNLPIVPPLVLALLKSPLVSGYDLSSVRMIFSGAAPLGEAQAIELQQRLNCQVRQGYGMTEASPVTHISPTVEGVPAKIGSVGRPVPNTEVKIVDAGNRRARRRAAGRRRAADSRSADHERLLEQARRHGRVDRSGGLVSHRRRRLRRRRGLVLHRRSHEGTDQIQGDAGGACGARGAAVDASRGPRRRGGAAAG